MVEQIVSSEDYIDNIRNCNQEFISLILQKEVIIEILDILLSFRADSNIQKQLLQLFSSHGILEALSKDTNAILYLEKFVKEHIIINDKEIVSNSSKNHFKLLFFIIQKLCIASKGEILKQVNNDSQLTELLISHMVNLSAVDFSLFLLSNNYKYIQINQYTIQKLLSITITLYVKNRSSTRFYCVFIFLQKLAYSFQNYINIICDPSIVGTLLLIGSNNIFNATISKMALIILAKIKDFTKDQDIQLIIQSFQSDFDDIQSLTDPRIPSLLHLYHSRIENLIIPFLEGETSTFISSEIILIIKQMDDEQFQKILNMKDFLKNFKKNFSKSRTNGHLTKLAQILIDKSSYFPQLKTRSWDRFKNTYIIPRIQICTSTYGGQTNSFFSSYANDSPPLKVQLKKILENNDENDNDI